MLGNKAQLHFADGELDEFKTAYRDIDDLSMSYQMYMNLYEFIYSLYNIIYQLSICAQGT